MNKIVNYKIIFKDYKVRRPYRNQPEYLLRLDSLSQKIHSLLSPSTLYKTIPFDNFTGFLPSVTRARWVAVTLFLVTVGKDIEEEAEKIDLQDRELFLTMLKEALLQSFAFVEKLIGEEAQKEGNEIFEIRNSLQQEWPEEWSRRVYCILGGRKIGIEYNRESLIPRFTLAGTAFWKPGKKKK